MNVDGKHYRTVWMEENSVYMIEQNKLPFSFEIHRCKDYRETAEAIRTMIVRGAGAIGVTAGYAMAQAFLEAPKKEFLEYMDRAKHEIEITRPTAQNLFCAINRVYDTAINSRNPETAACNEAQMIADEDAEACRKIGEHGNELIKDRCSIETHCNAGWLAFTDWGTALSPIYVAHRTGKNVSVYVDETQPRGQGARLTAWELYNENVPHVIIPDNAGAHYMSRDEIDMMIVGADRIAANGDTANKIGTLEKAIVAKRYGVPFYIAAPLSTFDLKCKTGIDIPIEERSEDEVLYKTGIDEDGMIRKILMCNPGSYACNPAFDVTPADLIAGIITEKGIVRPDENEIVKLFL